MYNNRMYKQIEGVTIDFSLGSISASFCLGHIAAEDFNNSTIEKLLFLSAYSRLGFATANIFIFMTLHLFYGRMPFLPPTLSSEGKLGHLPFT